MKLYLFIKHVYGDVKNTRKVINVDIPNEPNSVGPVLQQIIEKLYSAKDADTLTYVSVIGGNTSASKRLSTGKLQILPISDELRAKYLQRDGFIVVKNLPKELRPYKAQITDLVAEVVGDATIDESTDYDFRADMVSNIAAEYVSEFDGDTDTLLIAVDYIIDNFIA